MRKGRWVTLQLTRYPSHPNLVLPQVAWVEENHQTPAMKTLRARFKKTEVSLRPLRCPVSPDFQAPVPQGLAEEPLGLWNTVLGPSSDPSGSFHSTRPLPVLPRLLSTPTPPRSFCSLYSLSCLQHPAAFMSLLLPAQFLATGPLPLLSLCWESPLLHTLQPVKPSVKPDSSSRRVSILPSSSGHLLF